MPNIIFIVNLFFINKDELEHQSYLCSFFLEITLVTILLLFFFLGIQDIDKKKVGIRLITLTLFSKYMYFTFIRKMRSTFLKLYNGCSKIVMDTVPSRL